MKRWLLRIVTAVYGFIFPKQALAEAVLTRHQPGTWILNGLSLNAREDPWLYIGRRADGKIYCCALGLALVGKFGDPQKAFEAYCRDLDRRRKAGRDGHPSMVNLLGIPLRLAKRLTEDHAMNRISARQIAMDLMSGATA